MDNAPDWDAPQPVMRISNPSVVNVDFQEPYQELKYSSEEIKEVQPASTKKANKNYVQPSTSLMDNAPDWDAAQPLMSTSNPSVVNVNVLRLSKDGKDKQMSEKYKGKKYVKPSTSLMDRAPDWDAVQPATTTSNPSVVNVDGINGIAEEKRLVRPSSSGMTTESHSKTRAAAADTPFEYKQLQSIPKENPAGAKPIRDEDAKTKLPAAIAHAAGSSSDGWTPTAHFPSDDETNSPEGEESDASVSKKRAKNVSSMENYDQDALPRPTGVIPLTVSSSSKEKTQLFREEHSIEPVEDDPESAEETDKTVSDPASPGYSGGHQSNHSDSIEDDASQNGKSSSKSSTIDPQQHKDDRQASSNSSKKKLYLYGGGSPQPKDPWEFTMEGSDTKLDKSEREEASITKKKLVAYDRSLGTRTTNDAAEDGVSPSASRAKVTPKKTAEAIQSEGPNGGKKLKEKTVSPFTRTVSDNDDVDNTGWLDSSKADVDRIEKG